MISFVSVNSAVNSLLLIETRRGGIDRAATDDHTIHVHVYLKFSMYIYIYEASKFHT